MEDENNTKYQSGLECYGLIMRNNLSKLRYYDKRRPYAEIFGEALPSVSLLASTSYMATIGYQASNLDVHSQIVDEDFGNIERLFDIQ